MTKSDEILITIIEFTGNPKEYLKLRFFLKNTNELELKSQNLKSLVKI